MTSECYPITVLPNLSRIFREYVDLRSAPADAVVRRYYAGSPFDGAWMRGTDRPLAADRNRLVDALLQQNRSYGAGEAALANLEALRNGARAVVTGQQVGILGGPLLTLMKAATAVRKAQIATEQGVPHVPIFWMATEDHDLDEVNQAALLSKSGVETLRAQIAGHRLEPVGGIVLGDEMEPVLAQVEELLAYAPICELLRECYSPGQTLGSAFGRLMATLFRDQGLIVIDASSREFHALGADVLRAAIEDADLLQNKLLERTEELTRDGYHAQVLVTEDASLLFLVTEEGQRLPLRRVLDGDKRIWKAGSRVLTSDDLLKILREQPERISPNALLRPVFQDALLPTSAYVGGPAEIAYFAQCEVLYRHILGVMTPVLPRLSATLVEPPVRAVMEQHELSFQDALTSVDELAQRLGARAIPIEGKRRIATAGQALDTELTALLGWMHSVDPELARAGEVSASKMRYQMNRMRRIAANYQLQKEASLRKHAIAIVNALYPNQHPQERLLAGALYVAHYGEGLAQLLVDNAEQECPGHRVIHL
jgi:bacillithiol biosynthesis cysteine-adding enzyme BshC